MSALGTLQDRIAAALGWTRDEVRSFSLGAARDLVRPIDRALSEEISGYIARGLHLIDHDAAPVPCDPDWCVVHGAKYKKAE